MPVLWLAYWISVQVWRAARDTHLHDQRHQLFERRDRLDGLLFRPNVPTVSQRLAAVETVKAYSICPNQFWLRIMPLPSVVLSKLGSWNMSTTASLVAWTSDVSLE
jgi:hypothetical protein